MNLPFLLCVLYFVKYLFVYFERERERAGKKQERERERGRERTTNRLHAVSTEPDLGLELMNCEIMT